MKYLKYTLYIVLLVVMSTACDVDSSKFPVDTDKLIQKENTGGFLRVVKKEGSTFNLVDIDNQKFTVTLEADDAEQGGQLKSVEFFIGYDNGISDSDNPDLKADVPVPEEPFRTIEASKFNQDSETGLPRVTTSFTSKQLLDELPIAKNDLIVNSSLELRWQLNLTNGNSVNSSNSGPNITGGAFFSSPFAQNITQSILVPEDQFVGTYTFTQDSRTTAGTVGSGDGWLFGGDASGSVTLEVDPNNKLNGRVFKTDEGGYADGLGFGTPIDPIKIAFAIDPLTSDNFTTVTNQAGTGLSCGGPGIYLGSAADLSLQGTWDATNDEEFTLTISEDVLEDCASANPIKFTFTKKK